MYTVEVVIARESSSVRRGASDRESNRVSLRVDSRDHDQIEAITKAIRILTNERSAMLEAQKSNPDEDMDSDEDED